VGNPEPDARHHVSLHPPGDEHDVVSAVVAATETIWVGVR